MQLLSCDEDDDDDEVQFEYTFFIYKIKQCRLFIFFNARNAQLGLWTCHITHWYC